RPAPTAGSRASTRSHGPACRRHKRVAETGKPVAALRCRTAGLPGGEASACPAVGTARVGREYAARPPARRLRTTPAAAALVAPGTQRSGLGGRGLLRLDGPAAPADPHARYAIPGRGCADA